MKISLHGKRKAIEHRKGAFVKTAISVTQKKDIFISISAAKGKYKGKYLKRAYLAAVHTGKKPLQVLVNGRPVKVFASPAAYAVSTTRGYLFDAGNHGIVNIKTGFLSTAANQTIQLIY
ncbi:MAG: hypothetical protein NVSMB7_12330 [Chitinophagaceae bacterium]